MAKTEFIPAIQPCRSSHVDRLADSGEGRDNDADAHRRRAIEITSALPRVHLADVLFPAVEGGEAVAQHHGRSGQSGIRIRPEPACGATWARASTHVVIRDFTVLGELMARLADGELVTLAGPWWSLRPESPVYRQARIAAAQNATRRAGEYAQPFGGELGALIEAADTGLLTGHADQGIPVHAMAAGGVARGASAAESAAMDFEPVKQAVTAQVEARFGMLQEPRFG
jgi:uncharacterized protein